MDKKGISPPQVKGPSIHLAVWIEGAIKLSDGELASLQTEVRMAMSPLHLRVEQHQMHETNYHRVVVRGANQEQLVELCVWMVMVNRLLHKLRGRGEQEVPRVLHHMLGHDDKPEDPI